MSLHVRGEMGGIICLYSLGSEIIGTICPYK